MDILMIPQVLYTFRWNVVQKVPPQCTGARCILSVELKYHFTQQIKADSNRIFIILQQQLFRCLNLWTGGTRTHINWRFIKPNPKLLEASISSYQLVLYFCQQHLFCSKIPWCFIKTSYEVWTFTVLFTGGTGMGGRFILNTFIGKKLCPATKTSMKDNCLLGPWPSMW